MPNVRIVRLQAPATNTTQDYTISGFGAVQAAIVVASNANSGSDQDDMRFSYGFWDTTNVINWSTSYEHGVAVASSTGMNLTSTSNIVQMPVPQTSSVERSATISAVTDGIRLTWAGSDTAERPYVVVVLFNGLNGAQCGASTPSGTADAATTVTTSGITPKVIFGGCNEHNAGDASSNENNLSFGYAVDNGVSYDQHCHAWGTGNATSGCMAVIGTSYICGDLQQVVFRTAQEITDMSVGSFDHTTRNINGSGADSHDLYYLALDFDEGAEFWVEKFPLTASTDYNPYSSGGITPSAMIATLTQVSDNGLVPGGGSVRTNNDGGFHGFYVSDGTNEYGLGGVVEDSVAVTTNTSGRTEEALFCQDDTGGTLEHSASSPVFSSGDVTFDSANVTIGTQGAYHFGLVFEAPADAGNPHYYYAQM